MKAELRLISRDEFQENAWSGGTTTQIAIAPQGAEYAKRNFDWRISSATVQLEESDFTNLPLYKRWIAVLEGDMVLCHDRGEKIPMTFGRAHSFDGGAATKSWGQCRDFNLMLRKGTCDGTMAVQCLQAGEICTIFQQREEILLCYCYKGSLCVGAEQQRILVAAGEAAILNGSWKQTEMVPQTETEMVLCRIWDSNRNIPAPCCGSGEGHSENGKKD